MAKYLLQDIQGVMRGIRTIAKIGLQQQAEEISQRIGQSSFRPLAQSIFQSTKSSPLTSSSKPVKGFDAQEMAARAGAVLQGVQEQVKNVTGLFRQPAPVLQFDNGLNLYSDKINTNTGASRDHPTTAVSSNGQGNDWPEGEAGEAAKRAEKFMNPPVAPLDNSENAANELNAAESAPGDSDKSDDVSLKNFMKEETSHKLNEFSKDAKKTFIDGGGDSSIRLEDIPKISKVPPGVPIKADSFF